MMLGVALGRRVGRRVIARGEADGAARGWNGVSLQWYGEGRYYGPGAWQATPPYFYYPPDEPFAPGWKPWVLASAGQFRPVPPAFGSERFLKDLREVIDIQNSLTPEQLRIAKFWVDGSGSVTPPGHWNRIAQDLVRKHKLNDAGTAKLFAILNVALADAFIAVWDSKYHYWTARPITMAKTVYGEQLKPAILTPPFPSFVSGHAAFSGAAARVLGDFFPVEAGELDAMAEEAAMSRLYGGIHYRHDNEAGLALGRSVAGAVLQELGR
jgi:membrane-associated phospholipid phosphatase